MAKKRPAIKIEEIFKEEEEKRATENEIFDSRARRGLTNIPLDKIMANPNQPRKTFYEQTIAELSDSIKQHGVLSPIIVRPSGEFYEIIAGERRFRAAKQAGLREIPAIIKSASDKDSKIISLIENIQREDLNDIDKASALIELKASLGLSWEKIAQTLGLTKRRVIDLVGLLDLPEEVKEDIRQKKMTERHGRALRQLLDKTDVLRDVFNFIKEKKLTGEQTLELVQKLKGEPRFTIEEVYSSLKSGSLKADFKRESCQACLSIGQKLVKNLHSLKIDSLNNREKEELKKDLNKIVKEIQKFMETI